LIHEFTTKKLSTGKLQSDKASLEVTVDEILIILGTSRGYTAKDSDFDDPNRDEYISIVEERRHSVDK
jgi:hypothetical protein